jgi:hypothetical protein
MRRTVEACAIALPGTTKTAANIQQTRRRDSK